MSLERLLRWIIFLTLNVRKFAMEIHLEKAWFSSKGKTSLLSFFLSFIFLCQLPSSPTSFIFWSTTPSILAVPGIKLWSNLTYVRWGESSLIKLHSLCLFFETGDNGWLMEPGLGWAGKQKPLLLPFSSAGIMGMCYYSWLSAPHLLTNFTFLYLFASNNPCIHLSHYPFSWVGVYYH